RPAAWGGPLAYSRRGTPRPPAGSRTKCRRLAPTWFHGSCAVSFPTARRRGLLRFVQHSQGGPQLGTAGFGVCTDFRRLGLLRLAGQFLPHGIVAEGPFHQAVLQRMKTDVDSPDARFHAVRKSRQHTIQLAQLVLHSTP